MAFKKCVALGILCTLLLTSVASIAVAGTATTASVWTTDYAGTPKNLFEPGESIWIYWSCAPEGSTVDIRIVTESGAVVAGPWVNQPVANSPIHLTDGFEPGYYFIQVNGIHSWVIAVGTVFVVPESVFGTVSAIGAGLAAFATVGLVARKRKKY